MAEFPALPLWTDAYLADTGHLTFEEHGLYLNLLVLMWRSPECRIPNDDNWLERRFPNHANALRSLCQEFCTSDARWIWQKRLQKEWRWCKDKKQKNKQAAEARWAKTLIKNDADASVTHSERNAPIPTPTPLRDDDTSARSSPKSSITQEAIELSDRIANLAGFKPKEIPPSWCGAAFKVQAWLSGGWDRELIYASCQKQMAARAGKSPPSQIIYFEKGIADFIAQHNSPLPEGNQNAASANGEDWNGSSGHNGANHSPGYARKQTRDDVILAGMGRIADRLARDRANRRADDLLPDGGIAETDGSGTIGNKITEAEP